MSSMGGVCFWHEWFLLFPGSPGLLNAWLSVVSGASSPLPRGDHLHTACHHMLVLAPTWTHLNEGWRGPEVTGVVQPIVKCLRGTDFLCQHLPMICCLEYMT